MCLGTSNYISRREFLIKENHLIFPEDVSVVEDSFFTISLLLAASRVSHIDTEVCYCIQIEDLIIHKADKILKAKKAAECRLQYIQYMSRLLNDQELLCRESFKKERYFMSFITLHDAFLNLSIPQNWNILRELRDMSAYPIREQLVG